MANFDKSLYQAPAGLDELAKAEDGIEIEIVDPEAVNIHMDGLDISIEPADEDFGLNLAEEMDEGEMSSIAGDLDGDISNDKGSRKDWEKAYTEVLKLLGLHFVILSIGLKHQYAHTTCNVRL